ncbi:MAG: BON domain-containing protein [Trinickia sp.]|jgi:osmotically-inducible protein OsmY
MKTLWNSIATLAAGAAVMYYFDPETGRRRRAVLRDKVRSRQRQAAHYVRTQAKHVSDQARGALAEQRSSHDGELPASDVKLAERVRSKLGHLTSRPGAIEVTAHDGRIGLHGHILAAEHTLLMQTVRAVDGVKEVDDHLVVHDRPGNVPELQGEMRGHA